MNDSNFFKQLEEKVAGFELHHKILAFVGIVILTILFIRLGVLFYNPNTTIFNFELHHFDYGLLMLMVTVLLLLFTDRRTALHITLAGVSFGMILDEIGVIRKNLIDERINELSIYNVTIPVVAILVITLTLGIVLINHFKSKTEAV